MITAKSVCKQIDERFENSILGSQLSRREKNPIGMITRDVDFLWFPDTLPVFWFADWTLRTAV